KPESLAGSALADGLDREYSLYQIAIVTRAAPARLLGLAAKGHLGPGADADVTVYAPDTDVEKMFAMPRHVIKGGVRVAEDGQLRREPQGRTLCVARDYDPGVERAIRGVLEDEGGLAFEDYLVREEEVRPWS
ncbi:MAG TPA: amidohydrolase family protein, partial [Anaeromyxobacter sp.]